MKKAVTLALILVFPLACGEKKHDWRAKPLSVAGEKIYVLKGKIVARDAGDNSLRINHEAIPGFMEAMTMDYPVRGTAVSALPADQTPITAKLHVIETSYWITDVRPAAR
jgi:protein SCO1/2